MQSEHFIGKITQKALIQKEGRLLIQRHSTGKVFDLPGGRLHKNENPKVGFIREVKEELGIDIIPGRMVGSTVTSYVDGTPCYCVFYEVLLPDPLPEFTLDPVEVAEIRWANEIELNVLLEPFWLNIALEYLSTSTQNSS